MSAYDQNPFQYQGQLGIAGGHGSQWPISNPAMPGGGFQGGGGFGQPQMSHLALWDMLRRGGYFGQRGGNGVGGFQWPQSSPAMPSAGPSAGGGTPDGGNGGWPYGGGDWLGGYGRPAAPMRPPAWGGNAPLSNPVMPNPPTSGMTDYYGGYGSGRSQPTALPNPVMPNQNWGQR